MLESVFMHLFSTYSRCQPVLGGCYEYASGLSRRKYVRYAPISVASAEYIMDSSKVYRRRRTLCRVVDIQRAHIRHYRSQRSRYRCLRDRQTSPSPSLLLDSTPFPRIVNPPLKGHRPRALSIREDSSCARPLDTNMSKSTIIRFQKR